MNTLSNRLNSNNSIDCNLSKKLNNYKLIRFHLIIINLILWMYYVNRIIIIIIILSSSHLLLILILWFSMVHLLSFVITIECWWNKYFPYVTHNDEDDQVCTGNIKNVIAQMKMKMKIRIKKSRNASEGGRWMCVCVFIVSPGEALISHWDDSIFIFR